VLLARARCRVLQSRLDEARELLDRLLSSDADNPEALALRGNLEMQARQPAQAEVFFRRAIRVNPGDDTSRYKLYLVLSQQEGRRKEADAALQEYSVVHKDLERLTELLRQQVDRNPRDPKVPEEIGTIYHRLGQLPMAAYWLQVALKRDPANRMAHQILAEYYASIDEPTRAEFHRRRAR